MVTLNRHAARSPGHVPGTAQRLLFGCGIAYAVLFPLVTDGVGLRFYKGYDPVSQAISELWATGAPTKVALPIVLPAWIALLLGFGLGVRRSDRSNPALRAVGSLLITMAALQPLWLLLPLTGREDIPPGGSTALHDLGHMLLALVMSVLIVTMIGSGSSAFGSGFRLYSWVTFVVVLVCGLSVVGAASGYMNGAPPPDFGLIQRLQVVPWLLWMAVLASILLRRSRTATST